jgi:hypothetical protein
LVGIVLVIIGFNNCAQVVDETNTQAKNSVPAAPTQKVAAKSQFKSYAAAVASRLPAADLAGAPATNAAPAISCADSSLYVCVQQQFGMAQTNASTDGSFSCVTLHDGSSICPTGTIRTFNTENLEKSEFVCQVKLPGATGSASTSMAELGAALQQVYDSCLKFVNN